MRIWLVIVLLTAVSVLISSCGDDQKEVSSNFLNEVKKQEYTATETPAKPPVFLWNFSKKKTYTYVYKQEMKNQSEMGSFSEKKDEKDIEQSISAQGKLLIKSQGDGTANFVLKDLKMTMTLNFDKDKDKKPSTITMPPMIVQGMKENGSIEFGNSSQEILLDTLFPLPEKVLKVGESIDVPAWMPFNAMGSLLMAEGRSRITLTGYVKIGERTCAQLDVDTDISKLKIPEELEGDYSCTTKGTSVFYFDIEERCFVAGTVALIMQISIDAPAMKIEIPGEKAPDMPDRTKMSMKMDTLIQVSLEE